MKKKEDNRKRFKEIKEKERKINQWKRRQKNLLQAMIPQTKQLDKKYL